MTGVITDSANHTVRSRRRSDETYCYGLFQPDTDRLAVVRVRIYANGYCSRAEGRSADLVYGAATPLTDRMTARDVSVGGPMPFDGLFGIDQGPFWRGLWPFLFLAPVAVIVDFAAVVGIQGRLSRRDSLRRAR